jgi:hypothetical protein
MALQAQRTHHIQGVAYLVAAVAAVVILLAPQFVPACGGQLTFGSTDHHCNRTFAVVTGLALLALVMTIGSWWTSNLRTRAAFAVLLAGLAAGMLVAPRAWALGICRRSDMSCHQTELATAIPALVLLLVAVFLAISSARSAVNDRASQIAKVDPWDDGKNEPIKVPAPRRRKCCG